MAAVADPPQTPNKTKQTKSSYRPEIDGLRAFAVIAVIINHFNKDLLPSGYLGVDIFFVISGYVITSSLSGRESKNFGDFLSGFYERRIKRLVPALVFLVLVTSILICLFNPDPGTALKTGMASLFGLSNLYLFKQSTDYFAQSTELNPFTHTWSLGVEEQFYLLFPFLIWFSGFGRQAKNGARNLFVWISALTVSSLTIFICLYQSNQPAAYFLMPPRFWEMAAGCLIFIGFQKRAKIEQTLEKVPPLLVVTAIVSVMFLPISWAVPATISLVLLSAVLIACLKSGTTAFTIFTHKRVVYVGLISYSLYLWHWGVLSLSRWSIGIHWWSAPFQIGSMLLMASLSYTCIEAPLRRLNFRNRTYTLLYGASALAFTSLLVAVIHQRIASRLILRSSNPNITSTWWRDKYGNYIERCHSKEAFSSALLHECLDRDTDYASKPVAYLIGDSHARNYLYAAKKSFPSIDVRYLTMGYGCTYLPDSMISESLNARVQCSRYSRETTQYLIMHAKPGDIVFIGQALRDDDYLKRAIPAYFNHIKKLALVLDNRRVPVVLFDGTFPPGKFPELCSKEVWRPYPIKSVCEKPVDDAKQAYARFDSMAEQLQRNMNNVFYAPLRIGLCFEGVCGQNTRLGTSIWHDNGHITEQASSELSGVLKSELNTRGFFTYTDSVKNR